MKYMEIACKLFTTFRSSIAFQAKSRGKVRAGSPKKLLKVVSFQKRIGKRQFLPGMEVSRTGLGLEAGLET